MVRQFGNEKLAGEQMTGAGVEQAFGRSREQTTMKEYLSIVLLYVFVVRPLAFCFFVFCFSRQIFNHNLNDFSRPKQLDTEN